MKRFTRNPKLHRLLTLLMALVMTLGLFTGAYASGTANEAVQADRSGVLCIEYGYIDGNTFTPCYVGSAFLINENTLLTCYHVVHVVDEDERKYLANRYDDDDWEKHMGIQLIVANGTYVAAAERLGNAEVDFSILTLQDKIANHSILTLRKEPTSTSEAITALGFPYTVTELTEGTATKFTAEDVTATSGTVSKAQTTMYGINYIQHNALIQGGNSGGPLVDVDGYVVGINSAVDARSESYSYATAIDQVIISLDSLGIDYLSADPSVAPAAEETEEPKEDDGPSEPIAPVESVDKSALEAAINANQGKDQSSYTAESWAEFDGALRAAERIADDNGATQTEVDSALSALNRAVLVEKPSGINPILIGGIAAAVIVVVAVIVIVVLTSKKKESKDTYSSFSGGDFTAPAPTPAPAAPANNGGFAAVAPQNVQYNASYPSGAGETDVLTSGAGETSVLSSNAGETSVLSSKPYAILIRKIGGEQVTVSASNFTIGRERRRVDYCISNNTSVGRSHAKLVNNSHAKLVNNNGSICVVDLDSKNGTFVNGVKCAPNVSVPLHSGDTLTLADEDFEIKLI